jgi:pantothenate kinase-related protein Tda10
MVASYGPETAERVAQIDAELAEYRGLLNAATDRVRVRLHEPAVRSLPPGRIQQEHALWAKGRVDADRAARAERQARQESRRRELENPYPQPPDHGPGIGI